MKRITNAQAITIAVTVLTLIVNGLANTLPLNGLETGEISDRFDIYFVPAGYVFSIWGLIYMALIGFTIFQASPNQSDNALLSKIRPAYWAASIANVIWLFLWHYEVFSLTIFAMGAILISLIHIYNQFDNPTIGLNKKEIWLVKIPFSIYLGWISVATIANVTQVLYFIGWSGWGFSPEAWAVVMLLIAAILGLLMLVRQKDAAYPLVLIWAFAGIALKHTGTILVANSSWVAAGLLLIGVVLLLLRKTMQKN